MYKLIKKLFVALAVVFSLASTIALVSPTPVSARTMGQCDETFFGLSPWDCGLQGFSDHTSSANNQDTLVRNVAIIASNVLVDLTILASYLVIGFVIYGGYLYIFSNGDPGKVASGKSTLTRAFIGLAIVLLANVIFNSMRIAILGANGSFAVNCAVAVQNDLANGTSAAPTNCIDQVSFITNLLNWFIGTAGAVAVVFVLVGGIGYITSSGDPSKLQKSKNTILYSLVGLAIVALSLTITAFVSNIIRGADPANTTDDADGTSYVQPLIIAKEYHEN